VGFDSRIKIRFFACRQRHGSPGRFAGFCGNPGGRTGSDRDTRTDCRTGYEFCRYGSGDR
jgi:hypothetical protein